MQRREVCCQRKSRYPKALPLTGTYARLLMETWGGLSDLPPNNPPDYLTIDVLKIR